MYKTLPICFRFTRCIPFLWVLIPLYPLVTILLGIPICHHATYWWVIRGKWLNKNVLFSLSYQWLLMDLGCNVFLPTKNNSNREMILSVCNRDLTLNPNTRKGYFRVYFQSCTATREINNKIAIEWAHKQFITRVHTWHNESINQYKNDDIHTSSLCFTCSFYVLLMMSQLIADDVTMIKQLWCDHAKSYI